MIGGIYYINGHPSIGLDTIVEFVIYINMLTFPVSAIGWVASMIQRASASQKRLNEFLDTKPAIRNISKTLKSNIKGEILFENVSFTYPHTGIRALKDFDLHIKPGQKIAIVGRTGSGKSTVAQLLLRMYDVSDGNIRIDGKNIREWYMHDLRRQVSYVPQDVFLFSDSVENNIRFGFPLANRIQVEEAAKHASVHQEIMQFSRQYETMIGERGVTLSGGQKQRISIARALVKDPRLIIFDDCLSAVDVRTEKQITGHLDVYLKNKTAIFITHRIFSLFHFDRIVVMDNGRIAETGTHAELLARKGFYTEIYNRQQQQDLESETD
jgi:ATP-binding cassette subfamily B multidrug efflux pump